MVRVLSFLMVLNLTSCASHSIVYGKESKAPWGWTNTYCPDHPEDVGCK